MAVPLVVVAGHPGLEGKLLALALAVLVDVTPSALAVVSSAEGAVFFLLQLLSSFVSFSHLTSLYFSS